MSGDEFDHLLDEVSVPQVEDPPTATPDFGETYKGLPVVSVSWQHPKHELWAKMRRAKELSDPFYVSLPSGALGWVPWPGSQIVAQDDQAWEMDLIREVESDLRPAKKAKQ